MKGLRKRATFGKEERSDEDARAESCKVRRVRNASRSGRILACGGQAVCVCIWLAAVFVAVMSIGGISKRLLDLVLAVDLVVRL